MRRAVCLVTSGLLLSGLVAPAGAYASPRAGRTASTAHTVATTEPSPSMVSCLSRARANPGGVLVMLDGRLSTRKAARLRDFMAGYGRPTCVHRSSSTEAAFGWWTGLRAGLRPDVVVLAVPGTSEQTASWAADRPDRYLLGTGGSGVNSPALIPGWTREANGAEAGDALIRRLGEHMVNAHGYASSALGPLLTSSPAQCRRAVDSPHGVLVLGDSITSRELPSMDKALKGRGYVPCIWAQSSSRLSHHLERLRAGRVPLPKNVIVALGNNDLFTGSGYPYRYRADAWSMIRLLGDRNIVWPTIWRTKKASYLGAMQHNARAVNHVSRDLARERPTMRVPEWGEVVRNRPGIQYDGIHLTPTGLKLRYDMLADALDELLAA